MTRGILIVILVLGWNIAQAQQKNPPPPSPKVDEFKVESAIKRGAEALKLKARKVGGGRGGSRELLLLTLIHSGVKRTDPVVEDLLQAMLDEELGFTYRVALQAMVLEEIDRVKYQRRLLQCAQFLVDNQCLNGQWTYGEPTTYPEPSLGGSKDVATGGPVTPAGGVVVFGEKPAVRIRIPVKKQRDGPKNGDNSNSQYAALGLRACHDSGIVLPKEVVQKAAQWWRDSQCGDPPAPPVKGGRVATGSAAAWPAARGWSYGNKGTAYGSMTAGAVGALVICDYILGSDWKKDENVNAGLSWLRDNFTVTENANHGMKYHYYYLYGLERTGMLYGIEKLGKFDWYYEGATHLLDAQADDGSWGGALDTCFALLFLKKSTRALVESRDDIRKR